MRRQAQLEHIADLAERTAYAHTGAELRTGLAQLRKAIARLQGGRRG